MTTNQKLILGGLGAIILTGVCCFGLIMGSVLSKNRKGPAAVVASMTATPISLSPTTAVTTEPSPDLAEASLEPTPTNTRVLDPPATPTPIVIVVTATSHPTEPSTQASITTEPPPPPSPTPVPAVQPNGATDDFQALIAYAKAIEPIIDEGLSAAERDGDILEASKQNPEALCGGPGTSHSTLAADAARMDDLVGRLEGITPPAEAATAIHKPLLESLSLWGEALDNINQSCQTGNQIEQGFLRLEAVVQLGGAMLNFQVASDNFWRLVLVNGLETIIDEAPKR